MDQLPAIQLGHLPVAGHGDALSLVVSQADLKSNPKDIAQRLLDRWLLAFYQGPLLLEQVVPSPQESIRLR